MRYTDADRQLGVAFWYENLARYLVHDKPLSFKSWFAEKAQSHYDIVDEKLATYIEVKGASNMDQLKLFEDQLDFQLGELGFPIGDGMVWIFSYRNCGHKGFGKRRRPFRLLKKNGKSAEDLARFLGQNTNSAYVVDIRILDAIRKVEGTRRHSRDKARRNLEVNRRTLSDIADDVQPSLAKLGFGESEIRRYLPPGSRRIRRRRVETSFGGRQIGFELTPILPIGLRRRFLNRMNGNVQAII